MSDIADLVAALSVPAGDDPAPLTGLLFTPGELRVCGDVFDGACRRLEAEGMAGSEGWARANSLRTYFREAGYGVERAGSADA